MVAGAQEAPEEAGGWIWKKRGEVQGGRARGKKPREGGPEGGKGERGAGGERTVGSWL